MLRSHRLKFNALNAINKGLKKEKLYRTLVFEPISKLTGMLSLLIPIQLLIILNSDRIGRLGKFLPKEYFQDKNTLIALLCVVLVFAIVISTATKFYSIRRLSVLIKKLKKNNPLPIRVKYISIFYKAMSEIYLLVVIVALLLWISPIMACICAVISILHMILLEHFQHWNKNATGMILSTTPIATILILLVAILILAYFSSHSIIIYIIIFLLSRIFCSAIAKLDNLLLRFPEKVARKL